jgi:hypothetical protein
VEVDENALTTLQDDLTQVQVDLDKTKSDAGDEFATEIDAVDQAAPSGRSSLDAATTAPSALTLTAVGVAVKALRTSLRGPADAVESLYLVTSSLNPTGTSQARWTMRWKPALNAFAITSGDRFPAAETY